MWTVWHGSLRVRSLARPCDRACPCLPLFFRSVASCPLVYHPEEHLGWPSGFVGCNERAPAHAHTVTLCRSSVKRQTACRRDYPVSRPPPQHEGLRSPPRPCQHLLLLFFLILAALVGMKWCIPLGFDFHSPETNDIKHLFVCSVAIFTSSLEKCLSKYFVHVLISLSSY